jgi:hypothetical protein
MSKQDALLGYAHAWSLRDPAGIAAALALCWDDAGTYTDPATEPASGIEGLTGVILGYAAKFPGMELRPTSGLDSYASFGRFTWVMTSSAAIVTGGVDYGTELPGVDFIEFAPDDRISRIVGFFGPLS